MEVISLFGLTPGVYTNKSAWDTWFGTSYTSPPPFVLWTTGSVAGDQLPSGTVDTEDLKPGCAKLDQFFCDDTKKIGGQVPVIWQYAGSQDATADGGDWDVTWQPPSGFSATSATPPFCSCIRAPPTATPTQTPTLTPTPTP